MQTIAVLGAGRVGNAMARDLATKFTITAFDINGNNLAELEGYKNIQIHNLDLQSSDFTEILKDYDLVISAVPGFMGFRTLKKVIECGKDVVDISFFPEDPFELDILAKKMDVCAVVDCGVAPGMGNVILGRYNELMKVHTYECLVGGLPVKRDWPFQYKAGFSPIDVIEEYVRPARYVQKGELVVREALSDPELVNFEKVGSLESFNTDGLRTLINTMQIPDMIEKTLRYPGSLEPLRVLRNCGLFSETPVEIDGKKIKPIDLTSKLLFPLWKLEKEDIDITVMRITIKGDHDGEYKEVMYDLYDEKDTENQNSSMARTTGYTCTAVANLILEGNFSNKGINPPEYLGIKESHFNYILEYLKERNVNYTKTVNP
jgi:saccharopine dehydrogenase-like NADP-dependent oxidoreductase